MAEPHAARPHLEAEDEARAHWYALLSRLFYAPADCELLQRLAAQPQEAAEPDETGPLLEAWAALQVQSVSAEPNAVKDEFDLLFVGAGKAAVTPYTSAYAAPRGPDRHLLALRNQLNEWGLSRREQVFEVEDHVSAVCDAMRWLIEEGRGLEEQRVFFATFLEPALPLFCDAIERSPNAAYYRAAGRLVRAFVGVEKEAFDLHTAAG